MAIQVSCAACRSEFKVKDEHAGRSGRCPRCKAPVAVPAAKVRAPAVEPPAPSAPDEPDEYALAGAPGKPRGVRLRGEDGGAATTALQAAAPSGPTRSPA